MKKSTNLNTSVVGDDVKNALRTSYQMTAQPKLTVDWNLNRYTTPTATNTPSEDDEGLDIERFPIESIIEPLRPSKGAAKARVNEAVVSAGYLDEFDPRFYVSDTDDVYKYWTAPYPTDASYNFPNTSDGDTSARPRVTYDRVVQANKIIIRIENSWATPSSYQVRVRKTATGSFTAVGGSNPKIDAASGILVLYYNGTAWVSTRPANLVTTSVSAIEFAVYSMGGGYKRDGNPMMYKRRGATNNGDWVTQYKTDGKYSSLNVIAIEAHFETELTNRLITVDDTFDMSDKSQLYPIGTITTNTASLTLSNEDGIFNTENTSSPYYNLIEPNALFKLEYIYTISGVQHSVQEFRMYANSWANSDETTTVELEDYSKYLKEIKPNPWMIENKTSTEIVWRVLDSVGFVDYDIQDDDVVEDTVIPVFWTDGTQTVWEVLDELANATQTAIYFNSLGRVQVRTRAAAFKDTNTMDWNILGTPSGSSLPDLISWSPSYDYEANNIDVKYASTKWKLNTLGKPAMSKVWGPEEDTLVVRSSPLVQDITDSSKYMFLDQKELEVWPFESKVQIDGEIIQYNGKQFIYYTYTATVNQDGTTTYSNETKNYVDVTSQDDYDKYNRKTPESKRFNNRYTGGVLITERGVWNTDQRNHTINTTGWSTYMTVSSANAGTNYVSPAGFKQNKSDSTVTINTPGVMKTSSDTFWALRGTANSSSYNSYGTRFMFNDDSASKTQIGGMAYQVNGGSNRYGYYVIVRTTNSLTAADRKVSNEITVYSYISGKSTVVANGYPTAIEPGTWYDMDIYHGGSGNNQTINVYINGGLVASGATTAATVQPESGQFGFFAKGMTDMTFEYIYAIGRQITEPQDDYGFFDLKYGGIRGGQWEREYVWEMRTRRIKIRKKKWKKETYRHNDYVFDEFGPYVHEVREFDVKFDPSPVRYSYIFNTNEWFSAVPEYTSNPFGASFIIANTGRNNAVLQGGDSLLYAGAGAAVNQVCCVLGQSLVIADEETVNIKNDAAIRSRGQIDSELSNKWIQSKNMAKILANWMSNHWSDSVDEVEVEVFGNPLFEIGDVVDVTWAHKNLSPATHIYFVVGVKNSFEAGVKTTLTLRRRRYVS